MAKTVSEFGRRWDVQVPRSHVTWLVRKRHVGTPFEKIERDLNRRMGKDWPAKIKRQTIAFAQLVHLQNQQLFADVTSGNVG